MKADELTKPLGLEEKHFRNEKLSVPIIDSHLYTTLGRQLYELYDRYEVTSSDQRQIERLVYLLTAFTLSKESRRPRWWRRVFKLRKSKHGR